MFRKLSSLAIVFAFFGALAFAYKFDSHISYWLQDQVDHYSEKLGREIAEKHDVLLLLTFEDTRGVAWPSEIQVNQSGVEASSGPRGRTRFFNGSKYSFIETSLNWNQLGSTYTISTWVNLDDLFPTQDILFSSVQGRHTGLRLENGHMTLHIPNPEGSKSLSYKFESFDQYTHIAGTVDPQNGIAQLYENGILRASGDIASVDQPSHYVELGKMRWYAPNYPILGDIGESIIFSRALTSNEINDVHSSPSPISKMLSPEYYWKLKAVSALNRFFQSALKTVDYFHPGLHEGRTHDADLPEINLVLAKNDRRHFNQYHNISQASGRRVEKAAERRSISYVINGTAGNGFLRLDGSNINYTEGKRQSFILEAKGDTSLMGIRIIKLTPPEISGFLAPLFETQIAHKLNLPHVQNGLCRLMINGEFIGVYYFEDFERMGVFPGNLWDFLERPSNVLDAGSLFDGIDLKYHLRTPVYKDIPLTLKELLGVYDLLHDVYRTALINDMNSPLSSRAVSYRLLIDRYRLVNNVSRAPEEWGQARKLANILNEFMLLNDNPSPFYLLSNLDLDVFNVSGAKIQWLSSDPSVLSDEGKVFRPLADRPAGVDLIATISDSTQTFIKTLNFRVMPENAKVPAVMVHVAERLNKLRRVDCSVHYYEEHGSETPRVFYATQETRGGIKFRGNSSFWRRPKKPFNLRLDEPHYLLDETKTKHLFFGNGLFDSTFMRNKLSYDMFRSFGSNDDPRYAPEVKWAEVFVNGRYHGLYEMGARVHRRMLGFSRYNEDDERHAALYKHVAPTNLFGEFPAAGYHQKLPQVRHSGPYAEHYDDLMRFTSSASQEDFVNEFEKWMNLNNVIDFHILLNVTDNTDGKVVNLYVARNNTLGSRFFFIPWDYDNTFHGRNRRLSNFLFNRLIDEYPGYPQLLRDRWTELRRHQLSDEFLQAAISRMEHSLTGYIEWDFERWPRGINDPQRGFENLRNNVRSQLKWLDKLIEPVNGP
ncbi:CotH kinase family protein [Desulfonatronum thiodismutans]|uniref:CotH kinase family protein n=1 Tax=Desulfonatronum thiodismutans TaxID=159290 RepID=UPI0004ABD5BD|nr:CotH kinase family protein [Desulfonatronum thiodismutans]